MDRSIGKTIPKKCEETKYMCKTKSTILFKAIRTEKIRQKRIREIIQKARKIKKLIKYLEDINIDYWFPDEINLSSLFSRITKSPTFSPTSQGR